MERLSIEFRGWVEEERTKEACRRSSGRCCYGMAEALESPGDWSGRFRQVRTAAAVGLGLDSADFCCAQGSRIR